MTTLKIHVSEELFASIKELGIDEKVKVRQFFSKVAEIVLPILNKKLGYVFNDDSLYERFKTAHDVQMNISKENYKRLKIAHCEINTFSMGVIMRWFVKFAVNLAKEVGLNKMWRILICQIKRYFKNKIDIQAKVAFRFVYIYNENTKKTRKIPQVIVSLEYFDIHGKFHQEILRL